MIKVIIQHIFYELIFLRNKIFEILFSKIPKNPFEIPIIINNRNRYEYLLKLIDSLDKRGYSNIIIIDNDSTFPPLLEYYSNICKYEVIYLKKNLGHLALWKSNFFNKFKNNFYVYTDPDVEIYENCPNNFMEYLLNALVENPRVQKIGLGLITNDLPDSYNLKKSVIEWEKRFTSVNFNDNFYKSNVDTTFALYRPFTSGGSNDFKLTLRSKYPYLIHHLPWYINSNSISDEDQFYINNSKSSTFWTIKNKTN